MTDLFSLRRIGRYLGRRRLTRRRDFQDFPDSWERAREKVSGYSNPEILRQVHQATAAVRDGRSGYERDGMNFERIEYSWPVLSGLLLSAAQNGGHLNVVDFGGSLGSTYFQNRKYLAHLRRIQWTIVEQPNYVEVGMTNFGNQELRFEIDFAEALDRNNPHVVHFGSSLQYAEIPRKILKMVSDSSAQHLIFDRTPLHEGHDDVLTIQTVPPSIYTGQYPAWIFSEKSLVSFLGKEWELLEGFESVGRANQTSQGTKFRWKGLHFLRKNDVG